MTQIHETATSAPTPRPTARTIVTIGDFIAGMLAALTIGGRSRLDLGDTRTDELFAGAYDRLLEDAEALGVATDLVVAIDLMHGDSCAVRDALTALAARGHLVVFTDRTGRTLEIAMDAAEAGRRLAGNPLPPTFYLAAIDARTKWTTER